MYDVPSGAREAKASRELSSQGSPESLLLFLGNEPVIVVVAFILFIALDYLSPI